MRTLTGALLLTAAVTAETPPPRPPVYHTCIRMPENYQNPRPPYTPHWATDYRSRHPELADRLPLPTTARRAPMRLPSVVDYRAATDVVSPVKDQGQCGSCWAFSSAESLEGQLGLNGAPENVSAQNFVDCVSLDDGCDGGWVDDALAYAEKAGVQNDTTYPYTATADSCAYNESYATVRPQFYVEVPKGDRALREALVVFGPLSIALDATAVFQSYTGGILTDPSCDPQMPDHALLLTGYNLPERYWIVKNSWGANWGMAGYVYINSTTPNVCGISEYAAVPYIAPVAPAAVQTRFYKHLASIVTY
jgi:C1A family cysteine protease